MKRVSNTKRLNHLGGFDYRMYRIASDGQKYGYQVVTEPREPRTGIAYRLRLARLEPQKAIAARSMNRSE